MIIIIIVSSSYKITNSKLSVPRHIAIITRLLTHHMSVIKTNRRHGNNILKYILYGLYWNNEVKAPIDVFSNDCCLYVSVLRKRGKLISFLRTFFSSRPARTQLRRTGIMRERVFGCDLGEHLLNSEHSCSDFLVLWLKIGYQEYIKSPWFYQ